jgi:glucose/arabinose dehydrogenase
MRRALLAALLLAACDRRAPEPASTTPTSTASPPARSSARIPGAVPTDRLAPRSQRVTLDALPEPFATPSASKSVRIVDMPAGARLRVPAGFTVQIFADALDMPRWLARAPDGAVLVTETRENRITRLSDVDGDGVAEERSVFADAGNGLDIPFGMAFAGGHFFVGNHDEVRRYPFASGQRRLLGEGEKIADLPGGGYRQHWTRNVIVAPDGKHLFVSIGSRSNADAEPLPRASIQRMALDGSGMKTWASGLRNPVGMDLHPETRELHCTVNERDELGDDLVPDFLTRVGEGEFYGWPYVYLTPDRLDPRHATRPAITRETRTPDLLFQAHSAALGMAFYDGSTFPPRYRHGAFIAFRGSWNRGGATGYKLVFAPFERGRPTGVYEDFLSGFLLDPDAPTSWGRPVGVLTLPDGSLLFTEEMNGRIFRVQHP